jgi:hypothetical protein
MYAPLARCETYSSLLILVVLSSSIFLAWSLCETVSKSVDLLIWALLKVRSLSAVNCWVGFARNPAFCSSSDSCFLKLVSQAISVSSVCSPTTAVSFVWIASRLMVVNSKHESYGDCCSFNLLV